ncbi:MAG: MarR family winged helix-turn-helix transcriptional regulator [Candidatus Limnocylindria bacterium]
MPEDNASYVAGQDTARGPAANTTALLGMAYMALGRRIVDAVVAAGFEQRPAHSSVFAHIDLEGGTRLTTLAARANITPQALGELVDDLERSGYVTRRPDPDDRRAKRIVLTEHGRAAVVAGQRTIGDLEAALRASLGAERMDTLHDVLRDLIELSLHGRLR